MIFYKTHILVDKEFFFVVEILRSLITNQQIVAIKTTVLTITSSINFNQENTFVNIDVTISEAIDIRTFDVVDATTFNTIDAMTFDIVDTITSVITQSIVVNQITVTSIARKKSIIIIINSKKAKFTRRFIKAKSQKFITKNLFKKKKSHRCK